MTKLKLKLDIFLYKKINMSPVNHVYNLFWDFVDLKLWEKFGDNEFSYRDGMRFVIEEISSFSGWINEQWDDTYGEVLCMADTLDVLRYILTHSPASISIFTVTPVSLIDRYGEVLARVESGRLGNAIRKYQSKNTPSTPPRVNKEVSPPSPPRKRKRDDDDIEGLSKKLKTEEPSRKRKRDDPSVVEVEPPTFSSRLCSKMEEDASFRRWVKSGDCLRPTATRFQSVVRFSLPVRETCGPVEWKLEQKCEKDGITFERLEGEYEYVMWRRDLESVTKTLSDHYPETPLVDLRELAQLCVDRRIHPDDYDFRFVDEIAEWNKRLDLIPNTSTRRRRSKRLKLKRRTAV